MCSVLLLPRPDAFVTTQKPPDPCSTISKLRDKTWVNSSGQFIAPKHLTFMVRPLQQLTLDPCCFRSHTTAPLPTQDLLHTSKFPAAIHIVLVNRDTYNVNILLGLVIRQTILLVAEQHESIFPSPNAMQVSSARNTDINMQCTLATATK